MEQDGNDMELFDAAVQIWKTAKVVREVSGKIKAPSILKELPPELC